MPQFNSILSPLQLPASPIPFPPPSLNPALSTPPAGQLHPDPQLFIKMGQEKSSAADGSPSSLVRTAETLLRVAPMGLCLAALVVMLNNSVDNDYGSVSYANLTPFAYLVYANGICAAYSLFSAFFTAAAPRPGGRGLCLAWAVFLLDQVMTYVILAAGTVSAEIIFLAYNGDKGVSWSKECSVFNGFCKKATTSVGITFGAVVCYVMLSLVSSYRLFSAYEAPIPFLSSKGVEIAAFPR